jgi:hypothetical protein
MDDTNDTPESNDDSDVEGVDAEDLANLEVDAAELEEEGEDFDADHDGETDGEIVGDLVDGAGDGETDGDLVDGARDGARDGAEPVSTVDDDRLHLTDDDDEDQPRKPKSERDENELGTADDEEADLATILQEKLRSGDDLPPDDDGEVLDVDDVTDGTPLLQPRRPDEEHCQQCFLLVRRSAPKCPVDHDLCPLFPSA